MAEEAGRHDFAEVLCELNRRLLDDDYAYYKRLLEAGALPGVVEPTLLTRVTAHAIPPIVPPLTPRDDEEMGFVEYDVPLDEDEEEEQEGELDEEERSE